MAKKHKGMFKKGGGRIGGRSKRRKSHAIAHAPRTVTRTRTRTVHARRRRHGGSSGGGIKLTHLALASAGLAFLTGAKSPITQIKTTADQIPGAKTFGAAAMVGITALAVDRFIKKNKWLKLLGYAGIVTAAMQVGSQGTDFKFLGDADTGDYDLADEDAGDMGDEDTGDVGDDD